MRTLFLAIVCCITTSLAAQTDTAVAASKDTTAATIDTVPPYKNATGMPEFALKLPDGKWFTQYDLKKKTPTLILYFSPTCGHCQLETEEIISHMEHLGKLQIVMITSRPYEDMVSFYNHYKLERFPSITMGNDPAYLVPKFYAVKTTPFSALYDKKGKLVKVYEKGIDMDELTELVK